MGNVVHIGYKEIIGYWLLCFNYNNSSILMKSTLKTVQFDYVLNT